MVWRGLRDPVRLLAPVLAALVAMGAEQPPQRAEGHGQAVDFADQIAPILRQRCQVCHGAGLAEGGLRLDNGESALRGGYSGPVIVAGDSGASRLVQLVAGLDDRLVMPPAGERVPSAEVELLRAWIDQGAQWPETAEPETTERASGHWAFQAVERPTPPAVHDGGRVRNPIDQFVLARLEREGIEPSPPAGPATLIRRVSLDLTGLPPRPEDVLRFLADPSDLAYERWVDTLLDSPHYGERWAVHWLDLARYADSDGYEKDSVRPYAWRWRQWVIGALNRDLPFDRFTVEQVAGDLLPDAGIDQRIATGFHRNGLKNREGGVKVEQFRFEETVDRTNTIGTVWLGLTMGCAQCHDHKYDPISQRDYYRLFAHMNAVDEVEIEAPMPGEMQPYLRALPSYLERRQALLRENRVYELQPAWEAQMVLAADNPGRWTDWDHALDAVQKYLDNGEGIVRKPRTGRTDREQAKLEDHFVKNYHRVISKELREELDWERLREDLLALRAATPDITYARAVADANPLRPTFIHLRGNWNQHGIPVDPGTPGVLPEGASGATHPRLALAEWIASPENPLTARVAVNRIWQEYFGRGIVPTPDDFGTRSPGPSHPELLDWLAAEFTGSGWSLKRLHRTIVLSATYRQSSASRPDLSEIDAANTLLARQQRIRLPAEAIRDSALRASGLLDTTVGGPSVRPPQPEGVTGLGYANSISWQESAGRDRYRRGLYTFLQRTVLHPQLANFDMPERSTASCRRERSNTPLQALNLLNDEVFVEAARALALQVIADAPGDARDSLRRAFRLSLAREPLPRELDHLKAYLDEQRSIFAAEPGLAAQFMPLSADGVENVEAAAWAGLSSVLLNLDEFITRE